MCLRQGGIMPYFFPFPSHCFPAFNLAVFQFDGRLNGRGEILNFQVHDGGVKVLLSRTGEMVSINGEGETGRKFFPPPHPY